MSYLRVTEGGASYGALTGLESASARLDALQAQMSSGQQITKPSDDPSGTVQALQLRGELARSDQYTANSGDALAWMSTSDTTYSQIVTQLQSVRTLVVQGLNSGANDPNAQAALAQQVDALRTSLISLANTTYNGRPIFGGTTSGSAAYDTSGNYVGDTGAVNRQVGPSTNLQINQTGTQVFGAAGSDVFSLLSTVSSNLTSNPSALSANLAQIDAAVGQVSTAQAAEGSAYSRVQAAQASLTQTSTALKTRLSGIQDIDLASMAVQVSTANVNYQAALQTTASIRQMSLLEFLH
jgi:flagellar hook-associated protein 3 FlgL